MADLNDLLVRIDATTEQLRREMKRAEQTVDSGAKRIDRATKRIDLGFGKLNRTAVQLGAAFGVAFGVRGLSMYIRTQLQSADSMLKLSQRIGGTTESLSELQHVANLSGVQFNTMTMGLQRMTRRVAEAAQGTGEARGALKELGLSAIAIAQMPLDRQFEVIADRLSRVTSESDRVRLAMKLFDSEGVSLLQTMTRGAAGIREMRQEARELGLTLDEDAAQAAADANDAMTRMKASVDALALNSLPALAKAIEVVATGWNSLLFGADPFPFEEQISDLEKSIERMQSIVKLRNDPAVTRLLGPQIEELQAELDALIEKQKEALGLVPPGEDAGAAAGKAAGEALLRSLEEVVVNAKPIPVLDVFDWDGAIEDVGRRIKPLFDGIGPADRETTLFLEDEIAEMVLAAKEAGEEIESTWASLGVSMGRSLESSLADAFLGAEQNFGDMLKRMAAQAAASSLFRELAGMSGGVGEAFRFLGFGGARADGGPVSAGKSYLVGERGPEMFVPNVSGRIEPGGMGGAVIHVDARGAISPEEVQRRVEAGVIAAVEVADRNTASRLGLLGRPRMA